MDDKEKAAFYKTLGLTPGASEAELKAAHAKLIAFWTDEASLSEPLKKVAAEMRAKVNEAHAALAKSASSSSTVSGGTGKDAQEVQGDKGKKGWKLRDWVVVLAVIGGIGYYIDQEDRNKHKPPPVIVEPPPINNGQTIPPPQANKPPEYAAPWLHNGIAEQAARWTTEDVSTSGSQRIAVLGYDSNNRLINYLVFYAENGSWSFYEQYVVRYSIGDTFQVSVTHYQPKWQSGSFTFADQRNVSEVGDVDVRTTYYNMQMRGGIYLLDSVVQSTPFQQNTDGLQYERDASGQLLDVIRKPSGGMVNLEANRNLLPRWFDLWNYFGQYK